MRMIAQQANMGHLRQEQLEQTMAMRTPRGSSPDRNLNQDLRDQLADREAQLEHVRSERDTDFVQEELHICAYSAVKQKI